jgi:hypothetical protein
LKQYNLDWEAMQVLLTGLSEGAERSSANKSLQFTVNSCKIATQRPALCPSIFIFFFVVVASSNEELCTVTGWPTPPQLSMMVLTLFNACSGAGRQFVCHSLLLLAIRQCAGYN